MGIGCCRCGNLNGDRDFDNTLSEGTVFRLRAKMEDHAYQKLDEGGKRTLAFRVPGEKVELLRSLEYLSEFLSPGSLEGVDSIAIISDRAFEYSPPGMIGEKLEQKQVEDKKLYEELKGKLSGEEDPIVFTMENDILELYRLAIRVPGTMKRPDSVVGLELLRVQIPQEGFVVYLIFDDGYRKMGRKEFEKLTDDALSNMRKGPKLAKDPSSGHRMDSSFSGKEKKEETRIKTNLTFGSFDRERSPTGSISPSNVMREFTRRLSEMGYREDMKFSRPDANQVFLISMSGPAIFFKYLGSYDEVSSFLRVLEHRPDALGVLVSDAWDPKLEAISRIRGFIYAEAQRAPRIPEVVKEVVKGGG